ncbi:leucine-rich repeat-containing protein 42 isoform X1 [Esox lucius]|uniref:Leucine-rich repeat-containing protein 42 n=2 Tax=Esox lucius TaxID=8010 RepID=A0A3P9A4A2_ESOLU|nr:leucine-rich repeat-containing protein 42 isoform X1 [Esox lucius]
MVDSDSGMVYVRERGQLRRVNDIVLAETKSSARKTIIRSLALKKEHFIFTYNKEGSLRYSAKSLYDISLLFVAYNVHHVDSLIGFPEQVGERVFATAEEKMIFSNPDTASRALRLFSDAYGEVVLRSLCLRHRFPLLTERLEEIKTFHSLKCLDLFGCRLGDSHDVFQHLTSDTLSRSLLQLSLGGNNLSDQGLQRLTAPVRMMKRGLRHLQLLDLSDNPITEKAVGYLTCLPKLKGLDITGTHIKMGPSLKTLLRNMLGLVLSTEPLEAFDHSCCKTEGWAEQVVNQWELSATKLPSVKKIQESRTSAFRFFGRQKFVRDILSATPLVRNEEEDNTRKIIHFFKLATSTHTHQTQSTGIASGQVKASTHHCTSQNTFQPTGIQSGRMRSSLYNCTQLTGTTHGNSVHVKPCSQKKKRPLRTEVGDSGLHSPPPKRASSSSLPPPAFTAEDLDLFNSY